MLGSHLSALRATLTNASVTDSLSWNQEILTMVAMVSTHMGDMIVPWSMVDFADRNEASVLFLCEMPKIAYLQAEF